MNNIDDEGEVQLAGSTSSLREKRKLGSCSPLEDDLETLRVTGRGDYEDGSDEDEQRRRERRHRRKKKKKKNKQTNDMETATEMPENISLLPAEDDVNDERKDAAMETQVALGADEFSKRTEPSTEGAADDRQELRRKKRKKRSRHRHHSQEEEEEEEGSENHMLGKKPSWRQELAAGTVDTKGYRRRVKDFLTTKQYKWNPDTCGPNITILNCPSVARREVAKQATDGVSAVVGFKDGRHVIRFTFNDKPLGSHCAIGLCTADAQLHKTGYRHLLGDDQKSWGWDLPSKKLLHGGQVWGSFPAQSDWQLPQTITMVVDRDRWMLSFQVDNSSEHLEFRNLPPSGVELFPTASLVYGLGEVTIDLVETDLFAKYKHLCSDVPREAGRSRSTAHQPEAPAVPDRGACDSEPERRTSVDDREHHGAVEISTNESRQGPAESAESSFGVRPVGTADPDAPHHHARRSGNSDRANEGGHRRSEEEESSVTNLKTSPGDRRDSDDRNELPLEGEHSWSKYYPPNDTNEVAGIERKQEVTETEEEEEEDEDRRYTKVADLSEDDQYLMQLAHGWDFTNRGALVHPYPNVPYICVPLPYIKDKVQAIRSRREFVGKGKHSWSIRQLPFNSPTVSEHERDEVFNDMIIGAVSEEQRTFNFGFNLSSFGRHAWGFQPSSKLIWHDSYMHSPKDDPGFEYEGDLDDLDIDMNRGLQLTLNLWTHELTVSYEGRVVGVIRKVKGEKLYPFIVFMKQSPFPVQIEYSEGTEEYVQETITSMRNTGKLDRDDLTNFRVLLKRSSSRLEMGSNNTSSWEKYRWGCHSPGAELKNKNTVQLRGSIGVAMAEGALYGGRHRVNLIVNGCEFVALGLVENSYQSLMKYEIQKGVVLGEEPVQCTLGSTLHSWCWDVSRRKLYHAGRYIGRYPTVPDFDPCEVSHYTLTIDFGPSEYHTASFAAVKAGGKSSTTTDLGIAFVNLPASVLPAVGLFTGSASNPETPPTSVKIEYQSGKWIPGTSSEDTVEVSELKAPRAPKAARSSMCTLL